MSIKKAFQEIYGDGIILNYVTTKPTTGLSIGELFLLFHGDRPIIGICTSSAQTIKMITLKNTTVGRLTN